MRTTKMTLSALVCLWMASSGCTTGAQVSAPDQPQDAERLPPQSWVQESAADAIREQVAKEQHAGEFGMPLNENLDLVAFATGQYFVVPPRPLTPVPFEPLPAVNPYALINELSRQIRLRPGDPRGYELRANAYDALGWTWWAERDRERAWTLRMTPSLRMGR